MNFSWYPTIQKVFWYSLYFHLKINIAATESYSILINWRKVNHSVGFFKIDSIWYFKEIFIFSWNSYKRWTDGISSIFHILETYLKWFLLLSSNRQYKRPFAFCELCMPKRVHKDVSHLEYTNYILAAFHYDDVSFNANEN